MSSGPVSSTPGNLGAVGPYQLVNAVYLAVTGLIGLWIAGRRVDKLLLN